MKIIDKDGRIFYHHDKWECWKNGLYYNAKANNENHIKKSVLVLSNQKLFFMWCNILKKRWPVSFEVHISNKTINRQAWIGQAACCVSHTANQYQTISAWNELNQSEKDIANSIADFYIKNFEKENMNAENILGKRCTRRCTRTCELDV